MVNKLLVISAIGLIMAGSLFGFVHYAQANEQLITSVRAREIAQNFVGHGAASNVRLFSQADISVFEVYVQHDNTRYVVYINAHNGDIIRMEQFTGTAATGGTAAPNVTPTPSFRLLGPRNPAISLERAIQIGYEELARRGLAGAFRAHSNMGLHRGQWVWEIEFWVYGGPWPRYVEMYINVRNGSVAKFEWGS